MSSIAIRKIGITNLKTDAIVNAANPRLAQGGGVCGAIFRAAGAAQLRAECDAIGGCRTGDAVLTNGYKLPARYIIHTVGPIWSGGRNDEPRLLYSCYRKSLDLAAAKGIRSIGFPLVSAGIYGYPRDEAWQIAIRACREWIRDNPEHEMEIIFAVLEDIMLQTGQQELERQQAEASQP